MLILSELTSMAMLGHKAAREPYLSISACIYMHLHASTLCARSRAWIGKPAGLCVASCAGRLLAHAGLRVGSGRRVTHRGYSEYSQGYSVGRCADFELIRLKWAEKARLDAEREELLAQLEAALSPEVADQVQAIMISMKELRGSLRRVPSGPTSLVHAGSPAQFSNVYRSTE